MLEHIRQALLESKQAIDLLLQNQNTLNMIENVSQNIVNCLKNNGRIYSCGNGGSMSDAIHFAEELSGRFRESRLALPALAISDPGHITCTGNDFGFESIFSRFIEAHGKPGDILLAISTSGKSQNVVNAAKKAMEKDLKVICLTGRENSLLSTYSTWEICLGQTFPYADRIQEMHIKCIHILIELCERQLFPELYEG